MRNIRVFSALTYPVMLAASRKQFISAILGGRPAERLEGTLAVLVWGVLNGVKLVRVHDVQAAVRTVRMTEAVLHPEQVEALELINQGVTLCLYRFLVGNKVIGYAIRYIRDENLSFTRADVMLVPWSPIG